MAETAENGFPDIAVSEGAGLMALAGFAVLAVVLFALFALARWRQHRRERDGIYRKYRLPGERGSARPPGDGTP